MKAHGEWVQLSVFQCRMTDMRRAELLVEVSDVINHEEDSFMILDLGPSEQVEIKVETIGKHNFKAIEPKTQVF